MARFIALLPFVVSLASALSAGTSPEVHPTLQTWKCTKAKGCKSQTSRIVFDQLSHPIHQLGNANAGCTNGNLPDPTVCPDEHSCSKNCVVEGISDYKSRGVETNGADLSMTILNDAGDVVSPRVYLMEPSGNKYEMLQLTGGELAFDVDMSKLPCGMNGALYLSEMDKSGGARVDSQTGAYYGGGYCDAQCFVTPFINGKANIKGHGSCCNEMDVWEANAAATALTPHTCNQTGLYECSGAECTWDGVCDQWGCSYNPYAQKNLQYYGRGLTVDTNKPMTVVTQFPAVNGKLTEIRRLYVQNGKIIKNAAVNVTGTPGTDFISDDLCGQPGTAVRYMDLGATAGMGGALARGMVLIFSIWWDQGGFMNWLDTGNTGPCNTTEGDPKVIVKVQPDPAVVFSNIKWGELDSTYKGTA